MFSLGFDVGIGQRSDAASRAGEGDVAALGPVALYNFTDATSLAVGRQGSGGSPDPAGASSIGMAFDKAGMGGRSAAAFVDLQPQLIRNGTFDTDLSSWMVAGEASLSFQPGRLRATRTGTTAACGTQQTVDGLTVGQTYRLRGQVAALSQPVTVRFGTPSLSTFTTTTGPLQLVFVATATSQTIQFVIQPGNGTVGDFLEIADVSLRAVPGRHLIAPADGQRPVLVTAAGRPVSRWDGVDDALTATVSPPLAQPLQYAAVALRSTDPTGVPLMYSATGATNFAAIAWDATSSAVLRDVLLDGKDFFAASSPRSLLKDAVNLAGRAVVIEMLSLGVNGLSSFTLMNFTSSAFNVACDLYGAVLFSEVPSAGSRAVVRRWLAGLSGAPTQ